jgi:hypothetical protein
MESRYAPVWHWRIQFGEGLTLKTWHNPTRLSVLLGLIIALGLIPNTQAQVSRDIKDHSCEDLTGSTFGTIGNHSTIHFTGQKSITISKVEDHSNLTGSVENLTIGEVADHVFICTTGKVAVGKSGDHSWAKGNLSEDDANICRAMIDRPGECGN